MKQIKQLVYRTLTDCRSKKLRGRVQRLLKLLSLQSADTRLRLGVDEFYYRQKDQELEVLENKLHDSARQAMMYLNLLEATYTEAATRWKTDFQTLHSRIESIKSFNTPERKHEPVTTIKQSTDNHRPSTNA